MAEQKRVRIGDLLVEKGLISNGQLKLALDEQKHSGKKIGRVLIDLGLITEKGMLITLADYLCVPFVDISQFQLDDDVLQKLPENVARRYRTVVLQENNANFLIGMTDPSDLLARDEIQKILGKDIIPCILRESEILVTLDNAYKRSGEMEKFANELGDQLTEINIELDESLSQDDNAPVARLLTSILENAVQNRASDVHIEPDDTVLRVRFRVDGELQEQVMKEKRVATALVSRLKLMSNLNISEKRLPQDGRFHLDLLGRRMDVRIATMPTAWGESVVMRLLDQSGGILQLQKLGMPDDVRLRFETIIERPHGMVLVTGPTGSGKTTTLYAALNKINTSKHKIITVEDPVEYRLERINQVQVNSKIGLDFSTVLRSTLRHDPDVIMIGEIRDVETISIGVRASLTGHLVLSTLHTNDAISSALRLADMGVEPYLVASSLRAVLAQRLVRKNCEHCKVAYSPEAREKIWLENLSSHWQEEKYVQGEGCYHCNNTGYSGRIGVYELLELDEHMLRGLREMDSNAFLEAAMANPHFTPMARRALDLAAQGVTSLEEVFRISADLQDNLQATDQGETHVHLSDKAQNEMNEDGGLSLAPMEELSEPSQIDFKNDRTNQPSLMSDFPSFDRLDMDLSEKNNDGADG
jgi:MSHA biogenesis protein MshE